MFGLFGGGPKISVDAVKAGLTQGTMILVDVRDKQELHMTGTAKGAIHVPLTVIAAKCDPRSPDCLPAFKDTKLTKVLYCASGARSSNAASLLKRLGHEDVQNLGGLHNWVAGGGEVVNV
ncbi:MAG: sulfurtransferase [Alphaproteobacteria bacterium]|nr:sulfurtransferase [Alphaproteobacteria bacterium]MBU1278559.1 sulfurtransferase [Alphaproteobacteria bacterium]MBU1572889.1 sulfurtransferase [Alphaproteobacteria bacterium]MBU1828621.1 sulfurtransferase [Alphaproteobacteria bacterium]MBU2079829.1 sulfurtransferase [Alphaproteobacteria bacterium]